MSIFLMLNRTTPTARAVALSVCRRASAATSTSSASGKSASTTRTTKFPKVSTKEKFATLRQANIKKSEEITKKATSMNLAPFHFKAGIIVERPQVLVPEPEPWLKEYIEWRARWDLPILKQIPNITILDEDIDQAKQREADEAKAKAYREKLIATETPEEKEIRERNEAREKRMAELKRSESRQKKVVAGSRITEADRTNDRHSLYRKLDAKLFLVVKPKKVAEGEPEWRFPEGVRAGEETFRKTAERELVKEIGAKLETHFIGNAPVTFRTVELSPEKQKATKAFASKIFYQYAFFLDGSVNLNADLADYAWVTKAELKDYIGADAYNALEPALPNDGKDLYVPPQHYLEREDKNPDH